MRARMSLVVAMAIGVSAGCAATHLYGEQMRGVDLADRNPVYVVRHDADTRALDHVIAERLRRSGFAATSGPASEQPAEVRAIVSYEDHWQWDMSNYLLVLRIDFRDPQTEELLASGQSYRTSTARRPPEVMIDEVITSILSGGSS